MKIEKRFLLWLAQREGRRFFNTLKDKIKKSTIIRFSSEAQSAVDRGQWRATY